MTEFKLPELGENIDQGDLVRLMISPGASITEGQPVMELETDKAVVEVPSSVAGTVKEIRVKEGEKVKVGQVIFTVENGAGGKTKAAEAKAPAGKISDTPAQSVAQPKTESRSSRTPEPSHLRLRQFPQRLAQRNSDCPSLEKISIKAIWCG